MSSKIRVQFQSMGGRDVTQAEQFRSSFSEIFRRTAISQTSWSCNIDGESWRKTTPHSHWNATRNRWNKAKNWKSHKQSKPSTKNQSTLQTKNHTATFPSTSQTQKFIFSSRSRFLSDIKVESDKPPGQRKKTVITDQGTVTYVVPKNKTTKTTTYKDKQIVVKIWSRPQRLWTNKIGFIQRLLVYS